MYFWKMCLLCPCCPLADSASNKTHLSSGANPSFNSDMEHILTNTCEDMHRFMDINKTYSFSLRSAGLELGGLFDRSNSHGALRGGDEIDMIMSSSTAVGELHHSNNIGGLGGQKLGHFVRNHQYHQNLHHVQESYERTSFRSGIMSFEKTSSGSRSNRLSGIWSNFQLMSSSNGKGGSLIGTNRICPDNHVNRSFDKLNNIVISTKSKMDSDFINNNDGICNEVSFTNKNCSMNCTIPNCNNNCTNRRNSLEYLNSQKQTSIIPIQNGASKLQHSSSDRYAFQRIHNVDQKEIVPTFSEINLCKTDDNFHMDFKKKNHNDFVSKNCNLSQINSANSSALLPLAQQSGANFCCTVTHINGEKSDLIDDLHQTGSTNDLAKNVHQNDCTVSIHTNELHQSVLNDKCGEYLYQNNPINPIHTECHSPTNLAPLEITPKGALHPTIDQRIANQLQPSRSCSWEASSEGGYSFHDAPSPSTWSTDSLSLVSASSSVQGGEILEETKALSGTLNVDTNDSETLPLVRIPDGKESSFEILESKYERSDSFKELIAARQGCSSPVKTLADFNSPEDAMLYLKDEMIKIRTTDMALYKVLKDLQLQIDRLRSELPSPSDDWETDDDSYGYDAESDVDVQQVPFLPNSLARRQSASNPAITDHEFAKDGSERRYKFMDEDVQQNGSVECN